MTAICVALVALLQDTPNPYTQVDNVGFEVPAGWKLVRNGREAALVPELARKARDVKIEIVEGRPLTGAEKDEPTFARAMSDAWWDAIKKELKVKSGDESKVEEEVLKDLLAWPERVMRYGVFGLEGGGELVVLTVVYKSQDRVEAIRYASNDVENFKADFAAVVEFVKSVTFAHGRRDLKWHTPWREDLLSPTFLAPPVAAPKGDAGLHGVYWTADKGAGYDVLQKKFVLATLGSHFLTFLPDGGFYQKQPPEGLANFDVALWRKRHPLLAGSYRMNDDGTGTSTCRNGANDADVERKLKREGDKIWHNGEGPYFRMDSCDGFDLTGTWRRRDDADEKWKMGWATFKKDGTFEEHSFLHAAQVEWQFEREHRSRVMAEQTAGRGTWKLGNYTLELIYEDGRKRRAFACRPASADADSIMVNRFAFVRTQK